MELGSNTPAVEMPNINGCRLAPIEVAITSHNSRFLALCTSSYNTAEALAPWRTPASAATAFRKLLSLFRTMEFLNV